jgi:hypothetical protein
MRRFLSKLVQPFRATNAARAACPSRRSAYKDRAILNVEALETRNLMAALTTTVLTHVVPTTLTGVGSTGNGTTANAGDFTGTTNPNVTTAGINFLDSLSDPNVRSAALSDYATDGALNRTDMMDVFRRGTAGYTVCTSSAIESLEVLVESSNSQLVAMPAYVQNLAYKVVWNSIVPALDAGQGLNPVIVSSAPLGKPGAGGVSPNPEYQQNLAAAAQSIHGCVNNYFLGQALPDATFVFGGKTVRPDTWQNFNNLPLFAGTPNYQDVAQGLVDDCWLTASLAAIAARNPSAIKNMFINNGDDTYTVRLFNGSTPDYVTVNTLLPMVPTSLNVQNPNGAYPFSLFDHPMNDLWAALAEKACAQENANSWFPSQNPGTSSYWALGQNYASNGLAVLTGQNTSRGVFMNFGPWTINGDDIGQEWTQGQYVVLSSSSIATGPVVPSHAYAMVGSFGGIYQIFNPWGAYNPEVTQYPTNLYEDGHGVASDFFFWDHTTGAAPDSVARPVEASFSPLVVSSVSVTHDQLPGFAQLTTNAPQQGQDFLTARLERRETDIAPRDAARHVEAGRGYDVGSLDAALIDLLHDAADKGVFAA